MTDEIKSLETRLTSVTAERDAAREQARSADLEVGYKMAEKDELRAKLRAAEAREARLRAALEKADHLVRFIASQDFEGYASEMRELAREYVRNHGNTLASTEPSDTKETT